MGAPVPPLDDAVRASLTARFGAAIDPWFDTLPRDLSSLADRWQVALDEPIPRGSMSVAFWCRARDGRRAVLKVSPDRARLATEAAALATWATPHTPSVLAVDERLGALLLEAIEPGIALIDSCAYPPLERVAALVTSLRATGVPNRSYPTVADRVDYLFDAGTKPYERRPQLFDIVPRRLYEAGRQLARRLAAEVPPTALLHGDLTPRNILDGGDRRGLVAIDPAPCLGADNAFDAVDVVLWQADGTDTIRARAEELAPMLDVTHTRVLDWCTAFAAMAALELAEAGSSTEQVDAMVDLAARALTA